MYIIHAWRLEEQIQNQLALKTEWICKLNKWSKSLKMVWTVAKLAFKTAFKQNWTPSFLTQKAKLKQNTASLFWPLLWLKMGHGQWSWFAQWDPGTVTAYVKLLFSLTFESKWYLGIFQCQNFMTRLTINITHLLFHVNQIFIFFSFR